MTYPRTAAALAVLLALSGAGCTPPENGDTVSERPQTSATPSASSPPPSGLSSGGADPTGPSAGGGGPSSGRPAPPPPGLPTLRPPTGPPDKPSDLRRSDLLAGRISRGGSGPCYGLTTDDGTEYALYGENLGTWPTGSWVRVTVGPASGTAECGPGIRKDLLTITRVS
ncbi:hypothetical protein ACFOOK_23160 [Micromonospora krabiensis]|uniref:hypothetical protein n=1 Tax=Micromonospora krabiensis TaxID=307121 RepID=UPI000B80D8CA|nr:hypothetical protein [Micromonospora krabiensis]